MKQIIIARKDLNMSPGKLAAQVSHASMAFLINLIKSNTKKYMDPEFRQMRVYDPTYAFLHNEQRMVLYRHPDLYKWCEEAYNQGKKYFYIKETPTDSKYNKKLELVNREDITHHYTTEFQMDLDLYDNWINGTFTKIICEAKNKTQLEKAITMANSLDLVENKDFFLIKDNCYTELTPEEVDENGQGRTLTCIGFRPLNDQIADQISKKFQLYK